jgi:menaquinone-specific isochorismate synthase
MDARLRNPSTLAKPVGEDQPSGTGLFAWVNQVLEEGFSAASEHGRPLLYVRERVLEGGIPLEVFDSTLQDLHLFSGANGIILGIGRAREWQFDSPRSLREMKIALKMDHVSPRHPKIRLLGGWAFPPKRHAEGAKNGTWKPFPYSRWVIPALTFSSRNGRIHLVLAAYLDSSKENELKDYYRGLAKSTSARSKTETGRLPVPVRFKNLPSRKRWKSLVDIALESIAKGELKKVVLSRSVRILFDGDIPCSTVLKRLIELNPQSTVFAIRTGDATFLGATPERLLTLKGGEMRVDCLAASAPRSSETAVDDSLGLNMSNDKKSRYEHQLVVRGVMRSLSALCSEAKASKTPMLKKLGTVQHLHTVVRGRLLPEVDIWSAALSLWPTPATGGEPKQRAVRWLQDSEPASRGWYSGVVGCVDPAGDGDLVVSIRSGVIRGDSAVLFAGSGVVAGSDPRREFEETDWKMGAMMKALAVRNRG